MAAIGAEKVVATAVYYHLLKIAFPFRKAIGVTALSSNSHSKSQRWSTCGHGFLLFHCNSSGLLTRWHTSQLEQLDRKRRTQSVKSITWITHIQSHWHLWRENDALQLKTQKMMKLVASLKNIWKLIGGVRIAFHLSASLSVSRSNNSQKLSTIEYVHPWCYKEKLPPFARWLFIKFLLEF